MKASTITQARREFVYILIAWTVFMAWVIGYANWHAYPADPSQIRLTFGLPKWVFWGIAVPWAAATTFTVWFALKILTDHEQEQVT